MRRIDKGPPPRHLETYRLGAGPPPPTYADLPKPELRLDLLQAQGGLCCYCQGRIRLEASKIEHFVPQSAPEDLDLVWSNLWLACMGGVVGGRRTQKGSDHCDTRKKARRLSDALDPGRVEESAFRYLANGAIEHRDGGVQSELQDHLNLNLERLCENRAGAVAEMMKVLKQKQTGGWSRTFIKRELAALEERGPDGLEAYVGALQYWLRRRLARP